MILTLDFETRSRVNLKTDGADNYASDLSTDIICCSFINSDNDQEWLWYSGEKIPAELILAINLAEEVAAHNARFDQLIYEYIAVPDYNFPKIPKEKWVCTAAQCRVNALPSGLDLAARATDAKHKKDHSGNALIRKLSIPDKKTGEFNFNPTLIEEMGDYCLKDSIATVGLIGMTRELTPTDKEDWQVNERINDRGIMVDIELAQLAQKYATVEKEALGDQLMKLTDGLITKVTQTKRLLETLKVKFANNSELMECITKVTKDGEIKYSLDKAARTQLLDSPELDPYYREVLELIDQGGKSSVAKFTSMLNRADPDTDRVHGAFVFAGAGQTQRYSSKGLQLHNMKRACFDAEETEELKQKMAAGEKINDVMDTLAKLLRPAIIPAPDHKFVVGDWSSIEARVLPWLANSKGAEEALEIFRQDGDVYVETAKAMNMDDRQIGKVANLSLGYGGAVGAFQAMAVNYGLILEDTAVKSIVRRWRLSNKWATTFWKQLEVAAIQAVRRPDTPIEAGRVTFYYIPQLLGGTLTCILPNGTFIQYPYAKCEDDGVTAMKASVQPKADSDDEWPRMRLWGGFLAENITQATAACLLRELLSDMVRDDFPVVGHCHDEVILEVQNDDVEQSLKECQEYMETVPEWATGLPLKAIPEVFLRYGK